MAQDLDVPFLGILPLDPIIARSCDRGVNPVEEYPHSPAVISLNTIVSSEFYNLAVLF